MGCLYIRLLESFKSLFEFYKHLFQPRKRSGICSSYLCIIKRSKAHKHLTT